MDSTLGRRQLRLVLAWAELHQDELEENWRRARAGETRERRGPRPHAWPVFEDARTPEGFERAAVDPETGTVVWPGGADLAPDTPYERLRSGSWPDQDVAA